MTNKEAAEILRHTWFNAQHIDSDKIVEAVSRAVKVLDPEKLKVGDEVRSPLNNTRYIIYNIIGDTAFGTDFTHQSDFPAGYLSIRTGRHFPELVELMERFNNE